MLGQRSLLPERRKETGCQTEARSEHQDQIVEGVQEDGKEQESGKGGPEEEAANAPGRPGAGRLISAEGGIGSERHLHRRRPHPQGHTPQAVNWKTQYSVLATTTARVGVFAWALRGRRKRTENVPALRIPKHSSSRWVWGQKPLCSGRRKVKI